VACLHPLIALSFPPMKIDLNHCGACAGLRLIMVLCGEAAVIWYGSRVKGVKSRGVSGHGLDFHAVVIGAYFMKNIIQYSTKLLLHDSCLRSNLERSIHS